MTAPPLAVPGLSQIASTVPNDVAIVDVDGAQISFKQLSDATNRIGNALLGAGAREGDRVAIVAGNSAAVVAVILACSQIGVYYTLLNSRLAAPEVHSILEDAAPLLIVAEEGSVAATGVLAKTWSDRILVLERGPWSDSVGAWAADHPETPPENRIAGAGMFYTSGTSGKPKGVQPRLTHQTPEEGLPALGALLTRHGIRLELLRAPGVLLMTSQLYHAAPMYGAVVALHLGHTVVLMRSFDARASLELIDKHRVTWTQVVPTMMARWMALPEAERLGYDVSSLQWVIHAAAPCPVELKQAVIGWLGPIVYEYYSSTEVGGTTIDSIAWAEHPGSVGRAWVGAEVQILDDDMQPVSTGEVGNIYFRRRAEFEYRNDPAKTAASQHGDLVTVGDLGRLDAEGFVFIADRRSDLILRGGVNVYPAEIEDVLRRHPDLVDVAVVGVPHPDLGAAVHVIAQPAPVWTSTD